MAGRGQGRADSRCPACGLPLLVQWVGDVAALKARVTLPPPEERLPYPQALADRTPDDLVWCLPRLPHRALRLRWTGLRHPPDCPHQHLTTHKCPTQPLF
ncbi:hypothetical protein [Streptomyces sp. NPDC001492]